MDYVGQGRAEKLYQIIIGKRKIKIFDLYNAGSITKCVIARLK